MSDQFNFSNPPLTPAQSTILDEILEEVIEIETHLHSYERWMGEAAVPNGEIHVADNILDSQAPFTATAGNDTWGAWLQILGSSDTPIIVGKVMFDPHRIQVMEVSDSGVAYLVQLAFGTSGAAALAAGTYTDLVINPQAQEIEIPLEVQQRRQLAGTKAWFRVWGLTKANPTIDFYIGIHEYD